MLLDCARELLYPAPGVGAHNRQFFWQLVLSLARNNFLGDFGLKDQGLSPIVSRTTRG
jgi:hypothetical protein